MIILCDDHVGTGLRYWAGTGTGFGTNRNRDARREKNEDPHPLSSAQVGVQVFFPDLAFRDTAHDVWS